MLFKFQNDDPKEENIKISSVIEENVQLKQELKEAFQEINKMHEQIQQLSMKVVEFEMQAEEQKNAKQDNGEDRVNMSIFDQTYNSGMP